MNWRQAALLVATVAVLGTAVALPMGGGGTGWADDSRVRVVATFYPLAYFAEQVGGERVQVATLIPYNQEVHTWSPSTRDVLRCEGADVLLYNGAGLDPWFTSSIVKAVGAHGKLVVDTTANVTLLPADPNATESEIKGQWDPHTWVDPLTAKAQARAIYDALVVRDPAGALYYEPRWAALSARFDAAAANYTVLLAGKAGDTFFTIHAAFGYLAHGYGLHQRSLIGISADEQPSFSSMARAVEQMRSFHVYTIFINPQYPETYAQTLQGALEARSGHHVTIASLYQMLGPAGPMDYFAQQEANARALAAALGAGGQP